MVVTFKEKRSNTLIKRQTLYHIIQKRRRTQKQSKTKTQTINTDTFQVTISHTNASRQIDILRRKFGARDNNNNQIETSLTTKMVTGA